MGDNDELREDESGEVQQASGEQPTEMIVPPTPIFTKGELIAEAQTTFGVRREIMAGALHFVERATVDEAKSLLDAFLKREVS